MGINVLPPNILHMNEEFKLINNHPTYGITNIKHVGSSVFRKMINDIQKNNIEISKSDWGCFLLRVSPFVNKKAFESLILAGAFDCFKMKRSEMQHHFSTIKELTKRELEWLKKYKEENSSNTVQECLLQMIDCSMGSNKDRPIFRKSRIPDVQAILSAYDNPGYELYDAPSWLAKKEEELLGIPLTCNKVDEYDTSNANCTCKEFIDGFRSQNGIALAVQVESVREWTIKKGSAKGQKMGFITVSDASCSMDNVTAFSEEWEKFKKLIYEGNTVLMRGMRDSKRGSFLVKKVEQLRT